MSEISITGIRTVGVPVSDQDRALAFYCDLLGLEKRVDVAMEQLGGRWIEVAAPGNATSVALVPAGDRLSTGVETGIRLVATDAAAVHAALTRHGVRVGELLRWPGTPPMFAASDPDGNGFEIVE